MATKKAGFFPSENGDRKYNADDFREFYADFFTNGIHPRSTEYLQVLSASGMNVSVNAGIAYIYGGFFKPDTATTLTLAESDTTNPRYDIIVVRSDKILRDIYLDVLTGEPSAEPQYPTITRESNSFELALAAVYVEANATEITQADITDLRFNEEYCGVATGILNAIETENLFAQYNAEWNAFEQKAETEWEKFKGQLEDDPAGKLQAQIGDLDSLATESKESLVSAINENVSDIDNVISQMGDLDELTTSDKTNLVNAINEVASKGGNLNPTFTSLYSGSYSGNTFTENPENFDIVWFMGLNLYNSGHGAYITLTSPIIWFPKLNVRSCISGQNGILNTFVLRDTSLFITLQKDGNTTEISSGSISVYGIKLGG